jgi:hypothetical protein
MSLFLFPPPGNAYPRGEKTRIVNRLYFDVCFSVAFSGFGQLNQRPTGHVIRDRGEGKQDNPALKRRMLSSKASESLEQDSARSAPAKSFDLSEGKFHLERCGHV